MSPRTRHDARRPPSRGGGPLAAVGGLALLALLAAGCSVTALPTAVPPATPGPVTSLSPEAAAIPRLLVTVGDRELLLAGYDPTWPEAYAGDRRTILTVAPRLEVERGRTYDLLMTYQSIDPVLAWLPPDFGYIGGSEPVETEDGFVAEAPAATFIRADALPDYDAGLFGVRVETLGGPRVYAYPIWVLEPDVIEPDDFAGLALGISDEDGAAGAATFIDHVREDLRRGGAPEPATFATKAELLAAFEAGDVDAWIAIPPGWSDEPTTRNGFESGSRDPVTGNPATDTGQSYQLASLIVRALGPGGLVIDRGF